MKFGVIILVTIALAGCSRESVPTGPASSLAAPAPPTPPTGSALLWVMVISETGGCIEGATIQIVRAEGAGELIPQRTPCGAWDYDGGLLLRDLTPGVKLTLRGAASGYAPREMSFFPFPMPGSYHAVFIELSKAHQQIADGQIARLSDSSGNSRKSASQLVSESLGEESLIDRRVAPHSS